MLFYNLDNIPTNIHYPDIYFTPEYGKACEYSDNAIWELCQYKDLIYVYLKKEYIFEEEIYYDLITPYGYSGYYYENQETYNEFIPLFREEAKNKNYLTEVVRQNPYLNINISEHYNTIISRTTLGVITNNYDNFNEYLNVTHKDNKRGYNMGIKKGLICKIEEYNEINLDNFTNIYNITMTGLNASKYYYFNEDYYKSLGNLKKNIFFVNVYLDEKLIASCIIFKYNNLMHYHLGGSLLEYRKLRINNFLHCNNIKFCIENKYNLYYLGGGLKDNDSLFNFKEKISDNSNNYIIYKNILNGEIYDKIKKQYDHDNYFPIYRQ
jgi:hypothetical protein